ncbi:hypothetical protein Tco_1331418, partial [Tanacetum coccineum]
NYSLMDYEAFYYDDNHIKEKSSGSTITHTDFSQYDSFIFDLSINPFSPTDRSDLYHEEFAGELAHIISPPEYDHFCFKIEPELGNLTMDVVEDIFQQKNQEFMCLMIARIVKTLSTPGEIVRNLSLDMKERYKEAYIKYTKNGHVAHPYWWIVDGILNFSQSLATNDASWLKDSFVPGSLALIGWQPEWTKISSYNFCYLNNHASDVRGYY